MTTGLRGSRQPLFAPAAPTAMIFAAVSTGIAMQTVEGMDMHDSMKVVNRCLSGH